MAYKLGGGRCAAQHIVRKTLGTVSMTNSLFDLQWPKRLLFLLLLLLLVLHNMIGSVGGVSANLDLTDILESQVADVVISTSLSCKTFLQEVKSD